MLCVPLSRPRTSLSGRPGSCCLLGRDLGFHLPPRREDHLVPSLLEQCLALLLVAAPLLGSCLLGRLLRLLPDLIFQPVPLDQVRLRRLLGGLAGSRCRRRRGGPVGARRWWRLEGDGWLFTSQSATFQMWPRLKGGGSLSLSCLIGASLLWPRCCPRSSGDPTESSSGPPAGTSAVSSRRLPRAALSVTASRAVAGCRRATRRTGTV